MSENTPAYLEWGDPFRLRTSFRKGKKGAKADAFMREYLVQKLGLERYLD